MKLWLFRSNLRNLESYHSCETLEEFKRECWDFYLLQGVYFLEHGYLDEFIVWRLRPKKKSTYIINSWKLTNGSIFRQEVVDSFEDIFHPKYSYMKKLPDISFFRGGFSEYDRLVKKYSDKLGTTLYLGAGQRTFPKYGGKYDHVLTEEFIKNTLPFYKTANPIIFKPLNLEKKYDICFPANFTQHTYKGQKQFIEQVSKSDFLKSLKIIHVGNNPHSGKKMCKKFGVTNIDFAGHINRKEVNETLNKSKLAICYSNRTDGNPRVITEILCSETPLLLYDHTRSLPYVSATPATRIFTDKSFERAIKASLRDYKILKETLHNYVDNLSMENICIKNWKIWTKKDNQ